MVNFKLFKVLSVPSLDDGIIKGYHDKMLELLESKDESTQQIGRKIESALLKIADAEAEHNNLLRLAKVCGKTQTNDFVITVPGETLQMDGTTGAKLKQFTLSMLDKSIRNNRLEYLTAYVMLLKCQKE